MKQNVGGPWRDGGGVDHYTVGGPDTVVKGVATVMMCTFDALKDALKAGCNMVISHEPTYWSHPDTLTNLTDDPLYKIKLDYVTRNNMAVFHLHDHWHGLRPVDGIHVGEAAQLGWTQYQHKSNERYYTLPPMTLLEMCRHMQSVLEDRTLRVIGDPAMTVSKMYASYGNFGGISGAAILDGPDCDVMVIGEAQDWDLPMYVQDTMVAGTRVPRHAGPRQVRAMGHEILREWLGGFVKVYRQICSHHRALLESQQAGDGNQHQDLRAPWPIFASHSRARPRRATCRAGAAPAAGGAALPAALRARTCRTPGRCRQ